MKKSTKPVVEKKPAKKQKVSKSKERIEKDSKTKEMLKKEAKMLKQKNREYYRYMLQLSKKITQEREDAAKNFNKAALSGIDYF